MKYYNEKRNNLQVKIGRAIMIIGGILMIYIIVGIIILLIIYTLITYNTFIKIDNKVKEAFSTMDVYLKKRWDLIPRLVETVKGYASYEQNAFKEIITIRNINYDSLSFKEKLNTSTKINNDINKLMMLAENYPYLKANDNYLKLSEELTSIENDIANARKYYNGCVRQFNNKVEMFPNNILAKIFGYTSKKWFEAKDLERENIKL